MTAARAVSPAVLTGKWLLAAVVPMSALSVGAIPTEALVVATLASALACALLWTIQPDLASRPVRLVLIAFGVLLIATVLQVLPLPASLTRLLAPANAESWDRLFSPFRETGPAWHPLSLAPAATRIEVVRGFFYGCVFLGSVRIAALEHGRSFLVRLVVFSTSAMALVTLAHMAVNAEQIFGVYRPREGYAYRVGHVAPLLNLNHLAAYLNIGACVAVGAFLERRALPRALAAAAAVLVSATSVWQGSRGATTTLLFGLVLTVVLGAQSKKRRSSTSRWIGPLVAASVIVATIALSDVARQRLMSADVVKLDIAKASFRLVAASPWFGAGRGAFESVFWAVRESATYTTFTHPENLVAQWYVEWGVPISLAAAGLLAVALRPKTLLTAERPAFGAWVAILVTALHDLVDFHLEVPGVVALVAVCAAIVVGGRTRSRPRPSPRNATRLRLPAVGVLVPAGAVIALAFAGRDIGHSLAEERRAIGDMAVDEQVESADFYAALRAAMVRYPREPYLPLAGAVRAQHDGDPSLIAWIGRALELNPRFGRAHLVLARSLARRHPAQARLEYRLAFETDIGVRDKVMKEAVALVVDAGSAHQLVPEGDGAADMLEAMILSLRERLPATAVLLDARLAERSPGATGPVRRRIAAALADASDEALWCADGGCVGAAVSDAKLLIERDPTRCESHLLLAEARLAAGDAVRAADELERATEAVEKSTACKREMVAFLFRSGQSRRGELALAQVVRAGCGTTAECVEHYTWAANVEESRGHYPEAVRLYKRILQVAPDRDDVLEHIGELGTQRGVLADAVEAYGILARRHPSDPRWPARVAELRANAAPRIEVP